MLKNSNWPRLLIIIGILLLLKIPQVVMASGDKAVDPTHYGKVMGYIFDAATGAPLAGTTVIVAEDGTFKEGAKTTATSDAAGNYKCQAQIGRISSNFDWGKALGSSLIGIVSGSATTKTKRIDVSRLNLRVDCNGYNRFEGVVPCRSINTDTFSVMMEPIYLTKLPSTEVSTVAVGWGSAEIVSAEITPSITRKRSKITLTIKLKSPPLDSKAKPIVSVSSRTFGEKQLTRYTTDSNGFYTFSHEIGLPKRAHGVDRVQFAISDYPYYFCAGKDRAIVLLQIIKDDSEEQSAQLRLKAFEFGQKRQDNDQMAALQELSQRPDAQAGDKDAPRLLEQRLAEYQKPVERFVNATTTPEQLDSNISTAKSKVDADKNNNDFDSWHQYSILLLRKAVSRKSGDSMPADTIALCKTALIGALKCGRSGKQMLSESQYNGVLGYLGSEVIGVSGFGVPEANSDFVILQSLEDLDKVPNDYLSHLNLAAALTELGQADLASTFVDKCLALNPECNEAKYVKALTDIQEGNARMGVILLQDVLKSNPRHYRANLVLAKAYVESGDAEKASSYISAHESFYGPDARQFLGDLRLPLQGVDLAEKNTTAQVVAKVEEPTPKVVARAEEPASASVLTEPEVTNGPKYIKVNGSALVPLKIISEFLGATVDFEINSGIITITSDSSTVSLKLRSDLASVNGKLVQLSTPASERNGTAYVPLRFIGEAFSAKVKLDVKTGDIRIEHPSRKAVLVLPK